MLAEKVLISKGKVFPVKGAVYRFVYQLLMLIVWDINIFEIYVLLLQTTSSRCYFNLVSFSCNYKKGSLILCVFKFIC